MATRGDLKKLSRLRLKEAELLLEHGHYDGALYLSGYAIETALKARICTTLKWAEYKFSGKYSNFGTHNLEVLLDLSARANEIRSAHARHWSTALQWNLKGGMIQSAA